MRQGFAANMSVINETVGPDAASRAGQRVLAHVHKIVIAKAVRSDSEARIWTDEMGECDEARGRASETAAKRMLGGSLSIRKRPSAASRRAYFAGAR